jgi:predicted naringenin-chalcone synthase
MVWSVGDSGFTLHLSGLLPRMVATDLRMTLEPLAAANGSLFWAVHPGGTAILEAVEKSLELSPASLQVSRDVLRRYGNMSSPTIFFVLREMLRNPDVHGEGIALAFGPGLTVEAARLVKE